MLQTYKAILHGDRLEWYDDPPATLSMNQPVAVHVTILDDTLAGEPGATPGQQMATIIERLAQSHALSDVTDPVEWQRNLRGDRVLPDRDDNAVSAVSYVEVLGYHKLSSTERALFEAFFAAATLLPLSQPVLDQAVKLRQIRKITLGDALVAGTALAHG